jgi:hypothetical protein
MHIVVRRLAAALLEFPAQLAGRAFACKQMPLRAINSTQVLFI